MLCHRHVELEWTNRGKRTEHLSLRTAALRNHRLEQGTPVLRSQIRSELQLMLLERSRSHVALEMLPSGLVVHRLSNQARNPGQCDALLPARDGRRIGRNVFRGVGPYRAGRGISTGNE